MYHGTSFLWRFGNQDFLTSSLRSSDGHCMSCALALWRSSLALRARTHSVANLRFAPFSRSPAGTVSAETDARHVYTRGMWCHWHSITFCRFLCKIRDSLCNYNGNSFEIPNFWHIAFRQVFCQKCLVITYDGALYANTAIYQWVFAQWFSRIRVIMLQTDICPGFLRNPSRNGYGAN